MNRNEIREAIKSGKTALGIELGSTRIKAVLIGEDHAPIAAGSHEWENRYENGIWTYSLDDVWTGLQESYRKLCSQVLENYDTALKTIGAIGFSAMMHGYMAFDRDGKLLVPFRTWRNTSTGQASRGAHGPIPIQHSPALEHCPPLPGHPGQGSSRRGCQVSDDTGRLCPLEIDRAKSAGGWRSIGHVPRG